VESGCVRARTVTRLAARSDPMCAPETMNPLVLYPRITFVRARVRARSQIRIDGWLDRDGGAGEVRFIMQRYHTPTIAKWASQRSSFACDTRPISGRGNVRCHSARIILVCCDNDQ
jgi:hypothetical protein